MEITFSSYDELRCLHLALCEAKFHPLPDRKEVQGSPFVADTANKVYDLLISEARTDEEAEGWRQHRILKQNYMVVPAIKSRCDEWFSENQLTREDQIEFLEAVAAPYILTDELITLFLGAP